MRGAHRVAERRRPALEHLFARGVLGSPRGTKTMQSLTIELPEAALPLSLLRFQSDKFNVRGAGYVRHCRRAGAKFVVGLEFAEGLRWTPPEQDPTEPIPLCDPDPDYSRNP